VTKRIYPSDLTDAEYKFLKKCLPKQKQFGRPPRHDRREIFNAIFYLVRSGGAWRYLPQDYPPWKTCYHYFRLWRKQGLWQRINKRLRQLVRKRVGRHRQSSAAILDSQSVKTTETARAATVGFDSGKRVKGRKRHILVDTLGLLMTVVVHAANVSETAGGSLVVRELAQRWWRLRLIWLDGGYFRGLFEAVEKLSRWRKIRVEQVLRSDAGKGFAVLPKRWIVERTFGWLNRNRRLAKDYEALPETSEAMIYAVMIRLMLVRLGKN
jgi:putative transposase